MNSSVLEAIALGVGHRLYHEVLQGLLPHGAVSPRGDDGTELLERLIPLVGRHGKEFYIESITGIEALVFLCIIQHEGESPN